MATVEFNMQEHEEAHGQNRKRPAGVIVAIANWAQWFNANVEECIDSGVAPFPIGR